MTWEQFAFFMMVPLGAFLIAAAALYVGRPKKNELPPGE
jgi:hypothetical protein